MKKEKKHGGKMSIHKQLIIISFKKKLKSVKKPGEKPKSNSKIVQK
ncbi:hypothetical protein ACEQPO_08445 [Bacillus sp. SL00103]